MRKTKKLFLTLALGLTVAATATAVACNKDKGGANSSDWFSGQEESLVNIHFTSSSVKVVQYESETLSCKVSGTTSRVTFTSSNEEVATVDENGTVTALTLGKTTVTASVDGESATCEVTVVKSQLVPQIVLQADEHTVEDGETLQFSAETVWGTTAIDDAAYSVSLAEDSREAKATVSVEDNVVKVVTNGVETVNLIVSTTVRGIYTSEKVTVKVVAGALKIQALSTDFKPVAGKYETSVATTDLVGDMVNSIPMSFVVKKGNTVEKDAEITWSIDGGTVAIEGGNLVGKGRGTATLTGTVEVDGETATVEVLCDVVAPVVHLEEDPVELEIANLKTLRLPSGMIGSVKEVTLHDVKISSRIAGSFASLNKQAFPKEAAKLGAQQLAIVTDLVTYTMDATIYTMIINDAAELANMRTVADTGDTELDRYNKNIVSSQYYDGYFILGNDIDYNGTITSMTHTGLVYTAEYTDDLSRGFRGVFDGMGYNVDGLIVGANDTPNGQESGGLFGYISKQGIVRNVSFTNATVYANNGFLCSYGDGTIENVSISYKQIGIGHDVRGLNTNNMRYTGSFFTQVAGSNATVKNCLIDASAADIRVEKSVYNGKTSYPIKLSGVAASTENVITICPNQALLDCSGADVNKHTYTEVIAEGGMISDFDSTIWTTVEGIPMFVNQANTLDRDRAIEFMNMEPTLIAGMEMLVQTNNPYVRIEISGVEGVSLKNSLLTAEEKAFEQTVTVTATSLLNSAITATYTVYIDSFGTAVKAPAYDGTLTVYNTNPELKIGDESWRGEKTIVYYGSQIIGEATGTDALNLDLSYLEWNMNNVTVVTVKNGEREHFTAKVKVWYTAGAMEDATMIAESAFSSYRGAADSYFMVEVEADVDAPAGFEKVQRLDCEKTWPTALHDAFFNRVTVNGYSDIWFALKIVNAHWVWQAENYTIEDWVTFHFVQVNDGEWVAEVYLNGNLFKTRFGVITTDSTQVGAMFSYGGYWGGGFLIYNNGGESVSAETPTSVYATEIYAIEKTTSGSEQA